MVVTLVPIPIDVRRDFRIEHGRQHAPGTLTREVVEAQTQLVRLPLNRGP